MSRSTPTSTTTKRMDALLALPLARFRRALTRLSGDELAALETRLGVQRMKHRLARGGFGVERLRSPRELELLARRETALGAERAKRMAAPPAPIQLVFPDTSVTNATVDMSEKQAA